MPVLLISSGVLDESYSASAIFEWLGPAEGPRVLTGNYLWQAWGAKLTLIYTAYLEEKK